MLGHWELGSECIGGLTVSSGSYIYAVNLSFSPALSATVAATLHVDGDINFQPGVAFPAKIGVKPGAALGVELAAEAVLKVGVKPTLQVGVTPALSHELEVTLHADGEVNAELGVASPYSFTKIITIDGVGAEIAAEGAVKYGVKFTGSANVVAGIQASVLLNGAIQGSLTVSLGVLSPVKFEAKIVTTAGVTFGLGSPSNPGYVHYYTGTLETVLVAVEMSPFAAFWSNKHPTGGAWTEVEADETSWTLDEGLASNWTGGQAVD